MVFSQTTALVGLILNLVIAIYAFKKELLDAGGTVAAVVVGMVIFSFGGWTWLTLIIFFFVSSNYLTKYRAKEKRVPQKDFAKGGIRDFWQVIANGGVAAFLAVLYNSYQSPIIFAAFLGGVATVTADTWSTEIGVLEKRPRLVTDWRVVRRGTSGAVSRAGLATSFAAGVFIALLLYALDFLNASFGGMFGVTRQFVGGRYLILLTGVVALAGSLADSFIGATVQKIYYCKKCRKETEKALHGCGRLAVPIRGFDAIDNDAVNFLSSIVGGLLAAGLNYVLFP